jgi:hypothetical protein
LTDGDSENAEDSGGHHEFNESEALFFHNLVVVTGLLGVEDAKKSTLIIRVTSGKIIISVAIAFSLKLKTGIDTITGETTGTKGKLDATGAHKLSTSVVVVFFPAIFQQRGLRDGFDILSVGIGKDCKDGLGLTAFGRVSAGVSAVKNKSLLEIT